MSTNPDGVSYALNQLRERGHAREVKHDLWALTEEGLAQASRNSKDQTE